ncbi:MAG: UDP-N-acetylmuramate--L-alanine ligase [Holosporales bacterium]|jgi:UDP-N-acetylmuramate--alanine ligase|nr:UDP-N-acetylmuramate--L-alanine ligase [Holosporales bacterium]
MFAICDNNKTVHFIGIGGIGVSGIAEILHYLGYIVQGSDKAHSSNIERLEKLGVRVFVGHNLKHVENADVVVYSSAIKSDNVELVRARELKMPCLQRADMLSQIVRFKKSIVTAGSHGKTTVTSICSALLEMANFDPTVVNGGVINSYKTNARLGSGEWAVVESDESDGSFVRFFPTIGIITNIDKEHVPYYGSFENLKNSFKAFLNNIPFYGAGIVCVDDKNVCEIINDMTDRKIITYSIENDSMFKATNIRKTQEGAIFDVTINTSNRKETVKDISIPLLGDYNIRNSLSAIAVSDELGISAEIVKATLASFTGVWRRFTNVGTIKEIPIIDDYAHHPTEIKSLLDSARQRSKGKIIIIHQPHRFTRLNILFDEFCECFDNADTVIITSVYKADDTETGKIDAKDLYKALIKRGKKAIFAENIESLQNAIAALINQGEVTKEDLIIFSGAGSISKWAHEITKNWQTT